MTMRGDYALTLRAAGAASPLASALAAWRAIPPSHLAIAAAIGLAWAAVNTFGWWLGDGSSNLPKTLTHFAYEAVLTMFLLVLGIALADARSGADARRVGPYMLAVVAAAVAGEMVFSATIPLLGLDACACSMDKWAPGARSANMLPDSLIICGFVTAGYWYRRRTAIRLARLHAIQLERAQLMRRTMESRLQAMQACIEPQFLFDTLADVERLHASDPKSADRMLNELIVYLRAALPHLKESTSTVAKECELAYAYLNIRHLRDPAGASFTIEVGADAQDAGMPPMVLLPLIDHALEDGRQAKAPAMLRIGMHKVGATLQVKLRAGPGAFGAGGRAGQVVAGVRDRLRTLDGDAARLELRSDQGQQSTVMLEIPHERTDSSHR
ncbi:MAG: histidine kinase [Casimicrobiaceae bacterium]